MSVPMSGGTANNFVYANLPASVTLNANTTYYIVSQETQGGDLWYDFNTTIQTTNVASETTSVWSSDGATYNVNGTGQSVLRPRRFSIYSVIVSQPVITQQPQSQTVSAGAAATFSVTATGGSLSYQWSSAASGGSSFTPITGATGSSYTAPGITLAQSGTQYMCVVTNTAGSASSSAATLTVVASLPTANYVTSVNLGNAAERLQRLGGDEHHGRRIPSDGDCLGPDVCDGQHGQPRGENRHRFNGQDVSGASVSVSMSGGTAGNFVYASLPASVTLNANTTYYIVSQETQGGDQWYDLNTTIQTTNVASETTGVWSSDGATYNLDWIGQSVLCSRRFSIYAVAYRSR